VRRTGWNISQQYESITYHFSTLLHTKQKALKLDLIVETHNVIYSISMLAGFLCMFERTKWESGFFGEKINQKDAFDCCKVYVFLWYIIQHSYFMKSKLLTRAILRFYRCIKIG
jgi:hypothetical protein